jgi:hypothetical protein
VIGCFALTPPLTSTPTNFQSPDFDHEQVVRAYRQMATQLRAHGLTEIADRFAYRANIRQRRLYLRRLHLPQYLGSLFLDLIAGYGYRPTRSIVTYILVICAFAGAYVLNTQFAAPHLTWDEALELSISAFHGRGFFTSGISLGTLSQDLRLGKLLLPCSSKSPLLLSSRSVSSLAERVAIR